MKPFHVAQVLLLPILLLAVGCTSISEDCAKPEIFCAGLVTRVGMLEDKDANQAVWDGLRQARSEGIVQRIASIETLDARDYEANLRVFTEAGFDAIVTVGDEAASAVETVAQDYLHVYFIGADQHIEGDISRLPNVVWLVFPEDQQGFLAGAMTAAMTSTGRVAAICGSEANLLVKNIGDAFLAGAAYVNPQVQAAVIYHNEISPTKSLSDPDWGTAQAVTLVSEGVDVVFGCAGQTGTAAITAAAQHGAYVIGADFDQYTLLPSASPHILTSVVKQYAPGIKALLLATRDNQNGSGSFTAGRHQGLIVFAPYHEMDSIVSENVKQRMASLQRALSSGEIQIHQNNGNP